MKALTEVFEVLSRGALPKTVIMSLLVPIVWAKSRGARCLSSLTTSHRGGVDDNS